MFFPWTDFALLALESSGVISLRLAKISRGGSQAVDEIRLMFAEKAQAAAEAAGGLMIGGTPAGLVAQYRSYVEENRARLVG